MTAFFIRYCERVCVRHFLAEFRFYGLTFKTPHRVLLLDDLNELLYFMKQRAVEGDVVSKTQLPLVESVVEQVGGAVFEDLLLRFSSRAHREASLRGLKQKQSELERMNTLAQRDRDAMMQAALEQSAASDAVDALIPRARDLKAYLEEHLSVWTHPKDVHLIGELSRL